MTTTVLGDYVGGGLASARPNAATLGPTIPVGYSAYYFATDTGVLSVLAGGDTAWQTVGGGGGGGGDFTKIATHTCGVGETTVTFGPAHTIPATYKSLKVITSLASVTGGAVDKLTMQISGDATGGHYQETMLGWYGGGSGFGDTAGIAFVSNNALFFGSCEIVIPNYQAAAGRIIQGFGTAYQTGVNPIAFGCGLAYNQAVAVDQLDFGLASGAAFVTGSTFDLYGIK